MARIKSSEESQHLTLFGGIFKWKKETITFFIVY